MRIAFHSLSAAATTEESELLWLQTAGQLVDRGHQVFVFGRGDWQAILRDDGGRREAAGADAEPHAGPRWRERLTAWLLPENQERHLDQLAAWAPDLLVLGTTSVDDDLSLAESCIEWGLPYALNVQGCGGTLTAPHRAQRRRAFARAARCYFLSRDHWKLTERQLALRLANGKYVENPPRTPPGGEAPAGQAAIAGVGEQDASPQNSPQQNAPQQPEQEQAPAEASGQAAESPRVMVRVGPGGDEGLEALLELLRTDKWRQRGWTWQLEFESPVPGLEDHADDLIKWANLESLVRLGEAQTGGRSGAAAPAGRHSGTCVVLALSWRQGVPLSTVESMRAGNVTVGFATGRNCELLIDASTGFLCPAPTPELLDETLERVAAAQPQWAAIGRSARDEIEQCYSATPIDDFVDELLSVRGTT